MVYYPKSQRISSPTKELQYKFKDLSSSQKFIGIGSILSFFNVFFPWVSYSSNSSTEEKTFNGIGDITYLIGYIILILSLILFIFFILHLLGKKIPKIIIKEYTFSMFAGVEIILLAVIALSIYSKLYLYSAFSEIGLGISIAIIGGLLISIGSYMAWKEEKKESVKKTFMHLPNEEDDKKEIEKILQRSKQDKKTFSIEETVTQENQELGREPQKPVDEEKKPPTLNMFE